MRLQSKFLTTWDEQSVFEAMGKYEAGRAPAFLGDFWYKKFTGKNKVPECTRGVCRKLASLVPEQEFNTVFIQEYAPTREAYTVLPHRDPRNNVGYTVIALFDEWAGGRLVIRDKVDGPISYGVGRYDVAILPCTMGGVQGPEHWVTPVVAGRRVAVILNTIK